MYLIKRIKTLIKEILWKFNININLKKSKKSKFKKENYNIKHDVKFMLI